MAKTGNVTAFELDDSVESSPDGMHLPPLPGLWKTGEAVHPDALGMTLGEIRDTIAELSLPLKEVSVSERSTLKSFPPAPGHLRSEPNIGHPLMAGPGFGDADMTALPDPVLLDRAVENVQQVQEDAELRDEGAGQRADQDIVLPEEN